MMTREEIKQYAISICMPLMERCGERMIDGIYAEKADQVGFIPSFLENFCRPFWGLAPIIAEGEEIILNIAGNDVTVTEYMRGVLNYGFGENGWEKYKQYFDEYSWENQNITELAGLLIGIYFARRQLWEPLSEEEKTLYSEKLYEMALTAFDHSWPNNHYWFPIFAVTVLKRLGCVFPETERILSVGLSFLDGLYEGQGWYSDGVFGRFDYYEAWSLHMYPLLWSLIADESFDGYSKRRSEYISRTNEFLDFYTHWFDSRGASVPFGRSLSYRFAASALFPVAVMAGCKTDPRTAGRITAKNIEFFRDNCRTERGGILPEGYLYKAPAVVEGYTSDGGAYWCAKAFLALLMTEEHPFWQGDEARLPAEEGDFIVRPKHSGINMIFSAHDGIVTMYNNTSQYYQNGMHTHHFGNMRNWYAKFAYNSGAGFACSSPDVTAYDSMISLTTPDNSMTSHRLGFEDLGYDGDFLRSSHVPFANDPDSTIETWLLPLSGAHVRVHRVRLSREYIVSEGGFSLGRWNDKCPKYISDRYAKTENEEMYSVISGISDADLEYYIAVPQAGYHLYAPLAAYPCLRTKKPLSAGEYSFVTVCSAGRLSGEAALPTAELSGDLVRVSYQNKIYEINTKG